MCWDNALMLSSGFFIWKPPKKTPPGGAGFFRSIYWSDVHVCHEIVRWGVVADFFSCALVYMFLGLNVNSESAMYFGEANGHIFCLSDIRRGCLPAREKLVHIDVFKPLVNCLKSQLSIAILQICFIRILVNSIVKRSHVGKILKHQLCSHCK